MEKEPIFYSDGNSSVNQSRFIAGEKIFDIKDIVDIAKERRPANKVPAFVCMGIGVVSLFVGGFMYLVGAVLLGLGVFLFANAKDRYAARITTNSGQQDAILSPDEDRIHRIVKAVKEAIMHKNQ